MKDIIIQVINQDGTYFLTVNKEYLPIVQKYIIEGAKIEDVRVFFNLLINQPSQLPKEEGEKKEEELKTSSPEKTEKKAEEEEQDNNISAMPEQGIEEEKANGIKIDDIPTVQDLNKIHSITQE